MTKNGIQKIKANLETQNPVLDLDGFEIDGTRVAVKLIQHCTHLKVLKLGNAYIYDLSFLKNLVNLEVLYLDESCLQDISILGNLKKLKELNLGWNEIKNLEVLAELTQLRKLYIYGNKFEDIQVLSKLTELRELYLDSNPQIQDLSPLGSLKKLQILDLSSCKLQTLSLSEDLESLQELNVSDNHLEQLTLPNLPYLQKLDVYNNRLKDISFLSRIRALDELHLLINPIENIDFIKKIYGLSRFDVSLGKLDYPPIAVIFLDNQGGEIQDYIHLSEPPHVQKIWQLIKTQNTKNRDLAKQLAEGQGWTEGLFEAYVLFCDNNS